MKRLLYIGVSVLILIAVFFGYRYFFTSDNFSILQSPSPSPTPSVITMEQLAKAVSKFNFPPVRSETELSQKKLPSDLAFLIWNDGANIKVYSVLYTNNAKGYEIKYQRPLSLTLLHNDFSLLIKETAGWSQVSGVNTDGLSYQEIKNSRYEGIIESTGIDDNNSQIVIKILQL